MKRFVTAFVFLSSIVGIWADDTSDLFSDPEPDSQADTTQSVPLDAFNGKSFRFFETLDVEAYMISGMQKDGDISSSPYDALDLVFGSDLRIDKNARAYASFELEYPKSDNTDDSIYSPYTSDVATVTDTELTYENLTIKELFLDYSLGDVAIFRLGRQSATWGQGRIFNIGNLVTQVEYGMAAKMSTAIGPVAITSIAIKNDSEYQVDTDSSEAVSLASLAGATLAEYSTGWFSMGVSGFYHVNIGAKADAYIKSSFLGTDLFLEGLGEWGRYGANTWSGVAGLYRDFGGNTKWLKLQAETLLSGRGDDGSFTSVSSNHYGFSDWTTGFAATTEIFNLWSFKPQVLWLHAWKDNSGELVVGVKNTSLPYVELNTGVVWVYGGDDSRYVSADPAGDDRRLSLTVTAKFSFDIKN